MKNEPSFFDKVLWTFVGGLLVIVLLIALTSCSQPASAISPTSTPNAPYTLNAPAIYADEVPTQTDTWTVTAERLYVRRGPSQSYATFNYFLVKGQTVTVREWSRNGNGWAMIAPAEWVNGDYLQRGEK